MNLARLTLPVALTFCTAVGIGTTPVAAQSTTGLVAAYAFDEGTGSTVTDLSGNGNTGTLANTTWSSGKYGSALAFNGTTSQVTIPDAASLHLTTAMTLEAWVNPAVVTSAWRDVIYKGNDNYFLMATSDRSSTPAGGGIFGGTNVAPPARRPYRPIHGRTWQ